MEASLGFFKDIMMQTFDIKTNQFKNLVKGQLLEFYNKGSLDLFVNIVAITGKISIDSISKDTSDLIDDIKNTIKKDKIYKLLNNIEPGFDIDKLAEKYDLAKMLKGNELNIWDIAEKEGFINKKVKDTFLTRYLKDLDYAKLPQIFNDKKLLNTFCQSLYQTLKSTVKPKLNIEFQFNVTEKDLKQIAMDCRYAIKLDHKGMANNASTIASCLGMYLPTFTTTGLVTGDSFRDPIKHSSKKVDNEEKFDKKYDLTVIMPRKEYKVDNGEVKPLSDNVQNIADVIVKEIPKDYENRLIQLRQLYKDKVFDSSNVTHLLVEKIFLPLSSPNKKTRNRY